MPNHVTTYLRASRTVLDKLRGDAAVDFGQIIPPPDNIEHGGCNGEHSPGVVCWYTWNTENWGTKWGAYSIVENPDMPNVGVIGVEPLILDNPAVVRFRTAWSFPMPVMLELSRMFPGERIEVLYADEDTGYNYGIFAFQRGVVVAGKREPFGQATDEAMEFSSQVHWGMSWKELCDDD